MTRANNGQHTRRPHHIKHLTNGDLRKLWDAFMASDDEAFAPLGWEPEEIRAEMNARGDGEYCAL